MTNPYAWIAIGIFILALGAGGFGWFLVLAADDLMNRATRQDEVE